MHTYTHAHIYHTHTIFSRTLFTHATHTLYPHTLYSHTLFTHSIHTHSLFTHSIHSITQGHAGAGNDRKLVLALNEEITTAAVDVNCSFDYSTILSMTLTRKGSMTPYKALLKTKGDVQPGGVFSSSSWCSSWLACTCNVPYELLKTDED